jgi:hypothetical protein
VVPVTDCAQVKPGDLFEPRTATKYSLVRIARICAGGAPGCKDSRSPSDAPASACVTGEDGLYLDRISCVGCDSGSKMLLPGLHPVLVE